MILRVFGMVLVGLCLGCASGHCRQVAKAPSTTAESQKAAPDADNASLVSSGGATPNASAPAPNNPTAPALNSVVVYKEDGSLQCAMGKPVKLEEMEKELKGIPVMGREKKSDGMMRIQLCGSPTGMMNTYKIPSDRVSEALKRGFKKWNF